MEPTTPPRPTRPLVRALPALAAAWSVVCAALGLWWLLDPGAYPLDPGPTGPSGQAQSLVGLLAPRAAAAAFLALGLLGVPLAGALTGLRPSAPARRPLLAAGATLALVLGVLVPDVRLLSILGYALALAGPPVLVVLLVVGARRSPVNWVVLAVIGIGVLAGVLAGQIGEPTLTMLRGIRDGASRLGLDPLVLALMVLGGALFGALTVRAADRTAGPSSADRADRARRLERWGVVATWVAAVCPLPYALLRMTWLTPWPLGAPGGADGIDGGIRVFGLLLGFAAFGGALLTVGLVSRWGEVFPRWLPGLRGRPVPVAAAVVPAGLVSAVLCAAAVSLVMMSLQDGFGWLVLAIPAPIWGPALGLATYAYYRRRTTQRSVHDDALEGSAAASAAGWAP